MEHGSRANVVFFRSPLLFEPEEASWSVIVATSSRNVNVIVFPARVAISIPVAPALRGRWPSPSQGSFTRGGQGSRFRGRTLNCIFCRYPTFGNEEWVRQTECLFFIFFSYIIFVSSHLFSRVGSGCGAVLLGSFQACAVT